MSRDCLKLTTYFGERDRTGSRLLADVLLDAYEHHAISTSVLLRGVEGFGLERHAHTDRLLSLSEDLPLVSVAVDHRDRIDALLPAVMAIKHRGLLTLERARLYDPDHGPVDQDAEIKLTAYVGRQQRVGRTPAFVAVCELLHRLGFAGATALLGVDGTRRGRRTRARFFSRNVEVPMMIIGIGSSEAAASAIDHLQTLLPDPLLTLERVTICKRDGAVLSPPPSHNGTDEHGLPLWQKLMVHASEDARHDGEPLHVALVRRLRSARLAGATSLRGVWGFHGDHPPHGDKLLQLRRHVPVLTVVIDTPEAIARSFAIIDELTAQRGLVTSEIVPTLARPTP